MTSVLGREGNVGDRVKRPTDVHVSGSPLRYGTVVEVRHDVPGGFDGATWEDPTVYSVQWDDRPEGTVDTGYLPHGLDRA